MRRRTNASITVVQVRSYSRYSPETRCESEISPSNPSRRSSSLHRQLVRAVGVRVEQRDRDRVDALRLEDRDRLGQARKRRSGVWIEPSAKHPLDHRRPQVARHKRPQAAARRGRRGRRGRRAVTSSTSRNPRVEIRPDDARRGARAARSGRPSCHAGRATAAAIRSALRAASTAATTPRSGASGDVGCLPTTTSPVSSSHQTRSVNVPPTSTPRSVAMG